MTRLVVEAVHQLPGRPWRLVTGRLEGGPVRPGDECVISHQGTDSSVTVRSVELHSPPGTVTIGVD